MLHPSVSCFLDLVNRTELAIFTRGKQCESWEMRDLEKGGQILNLMGEAKESKEHFSSTNVLSNCLEK